MLGMHFSCIRGREREQYSEHLIFQRVYVARSTNSQFMSDCKDGIIYLLTYVSGDGLNLASFSNRKWAFNQSPIHVSSSRDETWLVNESGLNTSTHPSNSPFDSSVPLPSCSKAVFTILLPSTQVFYNFHTKWGAQCLF